MKIITIITCFLLFFSNIFAQNSRKLNPFNEISDFEIRMQEKRELKSDTNYIYSLTNDFVRSEKQELELHFPYPIIFIHGLTGSADTWLEFYDYALNQGWTYGGELPFCLNGDDDLHNTDLTSSATSDVYNYIPNSLAAADFYLINFNVATDGTSFGGNYNTPTQSNQAAIVKQGLAISVAVNAVINATGRNKVILFGHSMGGLAAREYLQNTDLWQSDGEHHIAKLITTGTPHGGSNATGFSLTSIFSGLDESSDAVRDLRTDYYYSGNFGVFLFGGIEDPDVMDDTIWGFYDYDVNCNWYWYDNIEGLNEKELYLNLDYSCIISDYSLDTNPDGGDFVVSLESANLKSFYSALTSETFVTDVMHTNMPEQIRENYEGFDEPDYYNLSYEVKKNEIYNGFITEQAYDAEYEIDYDDYVFNLSQNGWVTLNVFNAQSNVRVSILKNTTYELLLDESDGGLVNFSSTPIYLTAGTYYFEIYGYGDSETWQYPYSFEIDFSTTNPNPVGINNNLNQANDLFSVYPNPATNQINVQFPQKIIDGYLEINDLSGHTLKKYELQNTYKTTLDIENINSGTYVISVFSEKSKRSQTIQITK